MLRSGVSVPALMKLLGHKSPDMTMLYLEVTLNDLQREFQRAQSQRRYLVPTPSMSALSTRAGRDGVVDSLLVAQHALEMFRRALPDGASRRCLDRLSNRLTKIISEARKLDPQPERAEIGRLCRFICPNPVDSPGWPMLVNAARPGRSYS
jgi:hypothetical protein